MRLSPQTGRRIRKRVEEIAALERAVIDAAMKRRKAYLEYVHQVNSAAFTALASQQWHEATAAEDAAVDALNAAWGKSS